MPPEITARDTSVKSVLTKSNLPVAEDSFNSYVGCEHACRTRKFRLAQKKKKKEPVQPFGRTGSLFV